MMRMHMIVNNIIVNTVEVDNPEDFPQYYLIDASIGGQIGDSYIDGVIIPQPSQAEAIFQNSKALFLTEVRALREKALARLNGIGTMLLLREPPALLDEKSNVVLLIQGLLDITITPDLVSATDMTAVRSSVKAEYDRLVSLALPSVVKAFRDLDI